MSAFSTLSARWSAWSAKFAALTRRERAIVGAAVVFGGSFLIFNFGIDPLLLKARIAAKAETLARSEITQQKALLAVLASQNADPDAGNRQRLAKARQELAGVGERLARFEAGMVPPARMQGFLESLLAKNRTLELLELKTLPVTLVGTPAAADKPAAAPAAPGASPSTAAVAAEVPGDGIYQHGIEITLAGSYNDLLNYLVSLEHMPQRVMWNRVSLQVKTHPRNVMVLRVYTLSLDKNWLVV